MAQPTKLHLIRQEAFALLGPIRDELFRLETRARGYVERLDLTADDETVLRSAQAALAVARLEVERLRRERADQAR
jgi:hypothetical protein